MSVLDSILSSDAPSLVRHSILEPSAGPMTPIAAAVYAADTPSERYRINAKAPLLTPDADGFLFGRTEERAPSVVISSVAAEASRAEPAVYHDPELHPWLTAVEIGSPTDTDADKAVETMVAAASKDMPGLDTPALRDELAQLLRTKRTSSWELSHRHIDGWVRYALLPESGKTLWSQPGSEEYRSIVDADPKRIAAVSFNSLIWGYWLASGATTTHRRARTISSQIIGSGVSGSPVYATKSAGPLPASSATKVDVEAGKLMVRTGKGAKGKKPSNFGLGAVPASGAGAPLHFTCETIASLTSIALTDLRALRRHGVSESVIRASLGIAIIATDLASTDLHLRSECDLVEVESPVWGKRVRGRRGAAPLGLDIDALRLETLNALKTAAADGDLPASTHGDGVEKIQLQLSLSEAEVLLDSVLEAAKKSSVQE